MRLLQRDVAAELEQGALAGCWEEVALSPPGGEQDSQILNPALHWGLERGGDETLSPCQPDTVRAAAHGQGGQ